MNAKTHRDSPGIAWLPLSIALAILAALTVLPALATDAAGRADHPAALLVCWAMSAGFVRGVGFLPRHPLPARLFSTPACLFALALAVWRLHAIGQPLLA